jgi:hypothetical protein
MGFSCNQCGYVFSRQYHLFRHLRTTHQQTKPHLSNDHRKTTDDDRKQFTLAMMDHLEKHGAHGCDDIGDLCKRFIATNPTQWGGTRGQDCADGLCRFVIDQETSESAANQVKPEDRPVPGDATRESLKRLCREQINQHGGGHTKEDMRKTQRAARVLECCCKMDQQ